MCMNGVNTTQFVQMLDQIDDHIALEYRWVHRLAHSAGDGGYAAASEKLHEAQAILADVRALLDEAKAIMEDPSEGGHTHATTKLV